MFIFRCDTSRDGHYHWNRKCRLLPAGFQSSPEWMLSNIAPADRTECPVCRALEFGSELAQSARNRPRPVDTGARSVRRKRSVG
jgi:hypothetical protein